MMGIAQKVARNFSDAVRTRGQSYFIKGRVTVMAARAGELVARVRGTAKYRVRVRLRGSKLLASCTCPYFSPQGEPCKHLWATLLLADSRGLLQSPPVFPVRLVVEAPRRPTSPSGLPEIRNEPGMERQPPYVIDSELGVVGLGSPRPAGGSGGRGARPRARTTGGCGVSRWARPDPGARATGAPRRGTAGPRSRRQDPARGSWVPARAGSRRSTATASGCWSTSWTWPPPWRKTRWSSIWPAASARRPASGDRCVPGITRLGPPTSSTIPRTA